MGATVLGRHRRERTPHAKRLVDELYDQLLAGGMESYGETLLREYGRPGEMVTHSGVGNGVVSMIAWPALGGEPERLTHLIYGGCTITEVRSDLLARGLGGLAVAEVYPADAELDDEDEDEDDD